MTPDEHSEVQISLAAYVFGALDPAERIRVSTHIQGCSSCRDELAEFAVLPALISHAGWDSYEGEESRSDTVDAVRGLTEDAAALAPPTGGTEPAAHGDLRGLASVARRRHVRRVGRVAGFAALVSIVFAGGAWVGVWQGSGPPSQSPGTSVAGARTTIVDVAQGTPVGSADFIERAWGTQIDVTLRGMPRQAARVQLVAVGEDGQEEVTATCSVPVNGNIRVDGATSIPPKSLRAVEVRRSDGALIAAGRT